MAEQVPQSTIEDWLNKQSIHRSYISAISDILANPEHSQFNDRLKYLISAARILRDSEGSSHYIDPLRVVVSHLGNFSWQFFAMWVTP